MKVLVIGANGFLGQSIVKECLKKKWKVDCLCHAGIGNIPSTCTIFYDSELDSMPVDYDTVFLVASFIPHGQYNFASQELFKANIVFPQQVVKKFSSSKIVFSSSISVYGEGVDKVITEQTAFYNPTLYGLTKLAGEITLKFHPKHVIFRFSSLYGKGMYNKTFLPIICKHAKDNQRITLYGDGSRKQNYLHVSDAARLCVLASESESYGIYLGVSSTSYSNKEVAETVTALVPNCDITYTGQDSSKSFLYDNSLTKKTFKWTENVSLRGGIEELLYEQT